MFDPTGRRALLFASFVLAILPGSARAGGDSGALVIERIELRPTGDGFYDAAVGFAMKDAKLGKDGKVTFSIPVAHVHDADEAITKVHEPVKTLGEDLQRAYSDIHRGP